MIDGGTDRGLANVSLGASSSGLAYNPSNGYIYVANNRQNSTSIVDGTTNNVIATLGVGSAPAGVAYDPSNGYIYVENSFSDSLSIISTDSTTPIPEFGDQALVVAMLAAVAFTALASQRTQVRFRTR